MNGQGANADEAGPPSDAAPAFDADNAPASAAQSQGPESDSPTAEGGERGEGRRRGRGGRDRNRRDRPDETGAPAEVDQNGLRDTQASNAVPVAAAVAAAGAAASVAAASWASADDAAAVVATEQAPWRPAPVESVVAAPPAFEPPPVEAKVMPVAAPVAAPVATQSAPPAPIVAAPVEPFVLPISSLQAVVESSGLQWVGSDAEKIRAVREAMANEPKPVHVPRERKPVTKDDDGPLVLVETRKDLSQIKLPFETAAPEAQRPQ